MVDLFEEYLIRDHSGKRWDLTSNPEEFIAEWLKPASGPILQNDPLTGILERSRYTIGPNLKNVYTQLGLDGINVGQQLFIDMQDHPMTDFFGDSLQLIRGFVQSEDRNLYMQRVTGVAGNRFLNNVERIFFLTHGYGRPNKFVSERDAILRNIYKSACGTALICLNYTFELWPDRQDPQTIREMLSTIDLSSISLNVQTGVEKVSSCCSAEMLKNGCLEAYFSSIGMLPIYEHDPIKKVYLSNLSQFDLYSDVNPNAVWNYSDVLDYTSGDIAKYLRSLPDLEIIKIATPVAELKSYLNLETLGGRLRSVLVKKAYDFLTRSRYLIYDNGIINVFSGRLIDSSPNIWPAEEVLRYVGEYKILIDPNENPFDLETARMLNDTLHDNRLTEVIEKTELFNRDSQRLSSVSPEERKKFAEDCKIILSYPINTDDLRTFLLGRSLSIQDLPLQTLGSGDNSWFVIGMTLRDYAEENVPIGLQHIINTLKYYSLIPNE